MTKATSLSKDVLDLDCPAEVEKIGTKLRELLTTRLHKRGLVVAMSGGVDSSVCAALAATAVGPKKVFGLLLPEKDSSPNSLRCGKLLAEHLGIDYVVKDIAPTLEAIGCYHSYEEAVKKTFPDFAWGWKSKIVISGGLENRYNHFRLVVQTPSGEISERRLDLKAYLKIVAATNYKQRIRKSIEYFHADRLNYAVVGTPNRLEYDQGFFVKNGDGAADVKPIAHLYKTQVYALARYLELPEEICSATPTTDTYSLTQGQDEFYFGLPYDQMDLALWAYNHALPAADLAQCLALEETRALAIYTDIEAKRRTTRYLHDSAVLIEPVAGVG